MFYCMCQTNLGRDFIFSKLIFCSSRILTDWKYFISNFSSVLNIFIVNPHIIRHIIEKIHCHCYIAQRANLTIHFVICSAMFYSSTTYYDHLILHIIFLVWGACSHGHWTSCCDHDGVSAIVCIHPNTCPKRDSNLGLRVTIYLNSIICSKLLGH